MKLVKLDEPMSILKDVDFGDNRSLKLTTSYDKNATESTPLLTINMTCNKDLHADEIKNQKATLNGDGSYTLSWEADPNCGFDMFSFWNKLGWGQYIVEGALIVVSLFFCFWGKRAENGSLAVIGFFAGGITTYIFLNLFTNLEDADNHWYMWVVIGVSVLIGIIMAILLVWAKHVGHFAAGAFLGYILGMELYNLILARWDHTGTPVWYYVTVFGLAIVGGIIAIWLSKHMMMLGTAFGGAYFAVKLTGQMIGNYPDESTLAQKIAAGEFDAIPWYTYVYVLSSVVLGICGTVFQYMEWCQREDEKKEKLAKEGDYKV